MPDDKGLSPAAETKGVAEQFVGALGLQDLIIGGLALYSVRLRYGQEIALHFPVTGLQLVDVALLACAASLVGKVVDVAIETLQAFMALAIESWSPYFARLIIALRRYCAMTGREHPHHGTDIGDLAAEYVALASPARFANLERVRGTASLAYGAAVLAILYVSYLYGRVGGWWLWLVPAVFAVLGGLQQLHYYQILEVSLTAIVPGSDEKRSASVQT